MSNQYATVKFTAGSTSGKKASLNVKGMVLAVARKNNENLYSDELKKQFSASMGERSLNASCVHPDSGEEEREALPASTVIETLVGCVKPENYDIMPLLLDGLAVGKTSQLGPGVYLFESLIQDNLDEGQPGGNEDPGE